MEILNNIPTEIKNKIFLYLSHPCADMIKESFRNIGDSYLGFEHGYFNKYYKSKTFNMFRISYKTEYYWNNNLFKLN